MSIFVLKIIAMLTMVIDHSRYIVPEFDNDITKIIGRISFILFAFILSEGIWHTKDRKKYLKRLTLFAIVSQIPFMLFRTIVGGFVLLNILLVCNNLQCEEMKLFYALFSPCFKISIKLSNFVSRLNSVIFSSINKFRVGISLFFKLAKLFTKLSIPHG